MVTVALFGDDAAVSAGVFLQQGEVGGVQLKQAHFVAVAQQALGEAGRAAIKIGRGQDMAQVLAELLQFGRQGGRGEQAADALLVFAGFLRGIVCQAV